MPNVIITWTPKHNSGNRKSWARVVTAVDIEAGKGVKAFAGDYLERGENMLPEGAIVLEIIPEGSAKNGYEDAAMAPSKRLPVSSQIVS